MARSGGRAPSVAEEAAAALEATDKDVSIGGAGLAAQAIELGLVDELRMFRYPVVVGGGTPFLPPVTEDIPLELTETRTFGSRDLRALRAPARLLEPARGERLRGARGAGAGRHLEAIVAAPQPLGAQRQPVCASRGAAHALEALDQLLPAEHGDRNAPRAREPVRQPDRAAGAPAERGPRELGTADEPAAGAPVVGRTRAEAPVHARERDAARLAGDGEAREVDAVGQPAPALPREARAAAGEARDAPFGEHSAPARGLEDVDSHRPGDRAPEREGQPAPLRLG